MPTIQDIASRIKTITFDCYGTLIDWRGGLESTFRAIFGKSIEPRMDQLFETYVRIEHQVESLAFQSYRNVLDEVVRRVGKEMKIPVSPAQAAMLAEQLPSWQPFHDTNDALRRLKNRYRLGVLSNIDRELFDRTARHFVIPFDFVITAGDVRSFKPASGHFVHLVEKVAAADTVLHVAQSLLHDGGPAKNFGLAFAWINRYNESNTTSIRPLAEFGDLRSLADALCPSAQEA